MRITSPIFETMSGKIGGAVASKSRGGVKYLRGLVVPSNPRSTQQTTSRLIFSGLASAWRGTLNDAQRAAWTALANAQESGIDVYIRVNSQILLTGEARVDTPLSSTVLAASPLTAIAVDASSHEIRFTNTTFGDDIWCNIFASVLVQRSSRLAQQFPYRFIASKNLADATAQTQAIPADSGIYAPTAGDIVYVRFVQLDSNGKVAIAQEARVVVQA